MMSVYLLLDLLHRFSSSDYAELTEHSCFTDYARNLNGFGLTAIGLAHSHSARRFHNRNPARRPGGFEIRRKKMFDHLKPGDL